MINFKSEALVLHSKVSYGQDKASPHLPIPQSKKKKPKPKCLKTFESGTSTGLLTREEILLNSFFLSFFSLQAIRGAHFIPTMAMKCWYFIRSLSHSGSKKTFLSGRTITTAETCNLPSHNFSSPLSGDSSWPTDRPARHLLTLLWEQLKRSICSKFAPSVLLLLRGGEGEMIIAL